MDTTYRLQSGPQRKLAETIVIKHAIIISSTRLVVIGKALYNKIHVQTNTESVQCLSKQ